MKQFMSCRRVFVIYKPRIINLQENYGTAGKRTTVWFGGMTCKSFDTPCYSLTEFYEVRRIGKSWLYPVECIFGIFSKCNCLRNIGDFGSKLILLEGVFINLCNDYISPEHFQSEEKSYYNQQNYQ